MRIWLIFPLAGIAVQTPEEKIKTSEETQPQNTDNSFFGSTSAIPAGNKTDLSR